MITAQRVAAVLLSGMLLSWAAPVWGQYAPAETVPMGPGDGLAAQPSPHGDAGPVGLPIEGELPLNPSPRVAEPGIDPVERAWSAPAGSLEDRVERSLRVALDRGQPNLEGPARALLLDESLGTPLARAEAAVRLAPNLPAARMALAEALWSEDRAPLAALDQAREALRALDQHLEASLWLSVAVFHALTAACLVGAVWFLFVAGASLVPATARALFGLPGRMPLASRAALVAGALLIPAVLDEGVFGVALAFATLVFCQGSPWQRVAVCGALTLLLAGLYPLVDRAGEELVALGSSPVAESVFAVEHAQPSRLDLQRLRHAPTEDRLVARALALHAKHSGDLEDADQRFAALIDEDAPPSLLNNAANVRLALDRTDEAIELYEAAAEGSGVVTVLFNLSQAYGRAIRFEDQELALARAQRIDPTAVAALTDLYAGSQHNLVADIPVEMPVIRSRLEDPAAARRAASELRRRFAPGWLGRGLGRGVVGSGLALLLGAGIAWALRRIGKGEQADDLYAGIAQLLKGREATDPFLRMVRLTALRRRQARNDKLKFAVSLLVPAAAGVFFRRPVLGLLASMLFAVMLASWWMRDGVVADPLAIGVGATLLFGGAAVASAVAYVAVVGVTIAFGERS